MPYTNIRMTCQFLQNIEMYRVGYCGKEALTGQIRFFLAYSYIRLVALYGDVPLVEKVLTEEESKIQTRTPKAEVLAFAHGQLDQAIKELDGKALRKRTLRPEHVRLKARAYLWENDYSNLLAVTSELIGKFAQHCR